MTLPGLSLVGRTAVVLGGSSGIGLALAKGLAEGGADVVATARRKEQVEAAAAEIEARGRRTLRVTVDVTERASLSSLLQQVVASFGKVDILVNCAGRTKRVSTLEMSDDDWDGIMETNLTGTLRGCQAFAPHMLERGYGRIVNIASLASFVGLLEVAAYTASKSAVAGLTRALAVEWGPRGVNVNAIAPGVFRTALNTALLDSPRGKELLQRTPLARYGKVEELQGACVFLASESASFVNGEVLTVDGGFLASGVNQVKIQSMRVRDIRFPTSRELDGSDALNLGDYSATYVTLESDAGLRGHGLTFTNGRGNEICVTAARALERHVVGRDTDAIFADMRGFYRELTADKQLRWLGPEKGVLHMATGAVLNAFWDLQARRAKKPLWKLLVDMTPEQLVSTIDFTYISDVLTPEQALAILRERLSCKESREKEMREQGFPAYTTSTGWLGYPDEKVRRLCREAVAQGWTAFKMKVGQSLEDNMRRAALMRGEIGSERKLMMDANQCWDVPEAIRQMKELAQFDPWWIEEPTSPDDVLGHAAIAKAIAPIGVATGEVCHNRVIFKQLLQAQAIRFVQVDSCRMGGVNEVLSVLLMAAKFGVPVCPHAGGVGLCEYVQHLSIFDYISVGGSLENRICEYVDHLHEHFVDPCVVKDARYMAPLQPGYSIEMKVDSLDAYEFPHGSVWR